MHRDVAARAHHVAAHVIVDRDLSADGDHVTLDVGDDVHRAAGEIEILLDRALLDHRVAGVLREQHRGRTKADDNGENTSGARNNHESSLCG